MTSEPFSQSPVTHTEWLERQRKVLAQTAIRRHDLRSRIVFERGSGCYLYDTTGRKFIDLTCGFSVTNFGHDFKPLRNVVVDQLSQLTHLTGDSHRLRVELAERLLRLLPVDSQRCKVLFNATGARAVESAWKAAVSFRPGKLLTLAPAFHGKSIATAAVSDTVPVGIAISTDIAEPLPRGSFPYCKRCPLNLVFPACELRCAATLFHLIKSQGDEISAILVEPALGARGYVFPPVEFFHRLRELTSQAGVLLIADEIQTGLGRGGSWLLSHSQGWQADLIVCGKSLGGGIAAISAVVGRAEILDSLPFGAESETFSATPLACRIALEVLEQLSKCNWMQRGVEIGRRLREFCDQQFEPWGVIDGAGATCVLEFSKPGKTLSLAQQHAGFVAEQCFERGLLIHLTGPDLTRIVMLPPFTLTDNHLQEIEQKLSQVAIAFQD